MRISDWSSDVCSSDLPVSAHGACGVFGGEACGGDVVAGIEAAAVLQFGARGDAHDGGGTGQAQFAGEAARAGEPIGLARDGDAAFFDAAVALVVVGDGIEGFCGSVGEEGLDLGTQGRSEEHTSELQSLMRISYAVFCLKKKIHISKHKSTSH